MEAASEMGGSHVSQIDPTSPDVGSFRPVGQGGSGEGNKARVTRKAKLKASEWTLCSKLINLNVSSLASSHTDGATTPPYQKHHANPSTALHLQASSRAGETGFEGKIEAWLKALLCPGTGEPALCQGLQEAKRM